MPRFTGTVAPDSHTYKVARKHMASMKTMSLHAASAANPSACPSETGTRNKFTPSSNLRALTIVVIQLLPLPSRVQTSWLTGKFPAHGC